MKKDTRKLFRDLAFHGSLGMSVALSIFIGTFGGIWLDRKCDTAPLWMLIGLVLGIAAGFRNIGLAIRKSRNE